MSSTALRLAETLAEEALLSGLSRREHLDYRVDAAAELRRQHDELQMVQAAYESACGELRKQEALIAELVEALEAAYEQCIFPSAQISNVYRQCGAVLSKAKEQ